MSNRYKGGVISATPPTTTGGDTGTASGAWTLEQQMQAQAAGLWPIQPPINYIENVFSTYLYTGNSSTQTITNGIDITGKGGLVWIKNRTNGTTYHILTDTARGAGLNLSSNVDIAQYNDGQPTFNSTGFNLINSNIDYNTSANNYVSWTFREKTKFFDIVTYTGDGASSRNISHNLGSTPGCVMVKRRDSSGNWKVTFNFIAQLCLNSTEAAGGTLSLQGGFVNSADSGSFELFSSGGSVAQVNASGGTYVAYLFASNAGGFGPTESDDVITCGSYVGNGSNTSGTIVNLGWEPQWILVKRATGGTSEWFMVDNMRGFTANGVDQRLNANLTGAEDSTTAFILKATGFQLKATGNPNTSGSTYVYIAIRRGPMALPTVGTSVFSPITYTGNDSTQTLTTNFPVDLMLSKQRSGSASTFIDRLRGFGTETDATKYLFGNSTDAEGTASDGVLGMTNTGLNLGSWAQTNFGSIPYISWNMRRAPSFFDEVCYTGTGANTTITHNLAAVPELMIVKCRSAIGGWAVYSASSGPTKFQYLNTTAAASVYSTTWNDTAPTSSVFTVGTDSEVNASGGTYVAYLFATCAGVSKVGSYTGTGTTLQVDCGFTGGARFVLIKRTDSTGDWYVWDSARGIVSGNDPYLRLNSTAAEVTNTDYVDTYSAGFEITSTAPAGINANGGTYIFLAIA